MCLENLSDVCNKIGKIKLFIRMQLMKSYFALSIDTDGDDMLIHAEHMLNNSCELIILSLELIQNKTKKLHDVTFVKVNNTAIRNYIHLVK